MKFATTSPFKSSFKTTSVPKAKKSLSAKPKHSTQREIVVEEVEEVELVEAPSQSRSLALALGGTTHLPDIIRAETYLDESDTPKNVDRYKNMRANTNLVTQPTQLKSQISRKQVRGLTTMFGQRTDIILSLLEDDTQTDGALTLIQRTLLQTMVDLLPTLERLVRTTRGQRGVIPLNNCISQIRELTTDIQSLRDRGQLGASVVERTLRPAYLDLAVQISLSFTEIDNAAKPRMSPEDYAEFRADTLLHMKRTLATYVKQQYEDIKEAVVSGLS